MEEKKELRFGQLKKVLKFVVHLMLRKQIIVMIT